MKWIQLESFDVISYIADYPVFESFAPTFQASELNENDEKTFVAESDNDTVEIRVWEIDISHIKKHSEYSLWKLASACVAFHNGEILLSVTPITVLCIFDTLQFFFFLLLCTCQ